MSVSPTMVKCTKKNIARYVRLSVGNDYLQFNEVKITGTPIQGKNNITCFVKFEPTTFGLALRWST